MSNNNSNVTTTNGTNKDLAKTRDIVTRLNYRDMSILMNLYFMLMLYKGVRTVCLDNMLNTLKLAFLEDLNGGILYVVGQSSAGVNIKVIDRYLQARFVKYKRSLLNIDDLTISILQKNNISWEVIKRGVGAS